MYLSFTSPLLLSLVSLISLRSALLPYRGVDISSLLHLEKAGLTYEPSAGAASQPLETILKTAGINIVRQRVWVNPSDGNYNLDYNVRLAKRMSAAGMKIYLDLHFSDTWADPGKQNAPAAWSTLTAANMEWATYNHTLLISNRFATEKIPLEIISIGNEIGNGLLWPIGTSNNMPAVSRLLHSASWGIKDSGLSPKPRVMVHVEDGWDWGKQMWFYDAVLRSSNAGGLTSSEFDVIGVSYYPFYNSAASLSSLRASISNLHSRYGKPVQVVETDWPVACPNPSSAFPADVKSIPFSVAGQTQWVQTLGREVQIAGGEGVYYWEPGWVGNNGLGSSCNDVLMVEQSGVVRSSLGALGKV